LVQVLDLQEIDMVGAQPVEALIHCAQDVGSGEGGVVEPANFDAHHAGADQGAVPLSLQGPAEQGLRETIPVVIGSVKKVHARFDGHRHQLTGLSLADDPQAGTDRPKVAASEADLGYLKARIS